MPPRVRGRARGRPPGHARGRARGRGGAAGRGAQSSSSSSAPAPAPIPVPAPGVPDGTQLLNEIAAVMRDFTQAARATRNDIPPPPPPVAPAAVAPVVPVVQAEPRAQSAMREFGRKNPPVFSGETDPVQAELWLKRIVRIFDHLGIVEDHLRIDAATFQLAGRAQVWWELVLTSQPLEGMTWDTFTQIFLDKYFPHVARYAKRTEFLNLRQGEMSVTEYEACFGDLARFAPNITADDKIKAGTFESGLRQGLRAKVVGFELDSYSQVVQKTLVFEEEFQSSKKEKELRAPLKGNQLGSSSGHQFKKQRQENIPQQSSYSSPVPVQASRVSQFPSQPQQSQSRSYRRSGFSRGGGTVGPRNCYGCGDPNHIKRDCPFAQTAPQTVGPPQVHSPFSGPYQQAYRPPFRSPPSSSSIQSSRPNVPRGQIHHIGHRGGGQQAPRPPPNMSHSVAAASSEVAPDISVIRGRSLQITEVEC